MIEVQMFGGFCLFYQGKEIVLGRNSQTKFIRLLQLVWLSGEKGITKEQIQQKLYEGELLTDPGNSFNNLVYRLRRQMAKAGLPEGDYIVKKNGLYMPDRKLPVRFDVFEFQEQERAAGQKTEESDVYQCHKKAFDLYKGELLSGTSDELWIIEERRQYERLYENCVRWLGDYYKRKKYFREMFFLYSRAAEIYPFCDWQAEQIDCLFCQGKYREAQEIYQRTVRLYAKELGLPPSARMVDCYERMSQYFTGNTIEITEIKRQLRELLPRQDDGAPPRKAGAYCCSYSSFLELYRMCVRNMERSRLSVCLMLCTLVDYEGKMIRDQEKLKKRTEALEAAISLSLRKGDSFARYNASQYLILLMGTDRKGCDVIGRRIGRKLKELCGSRAKMQYSAATLEECMEVSEKIKKQ